MILDIDYSGLLGQQQQTDHNTIVDIKEKRPVQSNYSRDKVRQHGLDLITICDKKRRLGHPSYQFHYDGDAADAHCLSVTVMSANSLIFTPDVELEGAPGNYIVSIKWPPMPEPPIKQVRKPKAKVPTNNNTNNNNSDGPNKRIKLDIDDCSAATTTDQC